MAAICSSTAARLGERRESTFGLRLWRAIRFLACFDFLRRTLYKGARAPFFAAVVSIQSGKCYCSPGAP